MLYVAPMARSYLESNPSSVAYSWENEHFVFRWNVDRFECKDLKHETKWRIAGAGSLIFVEREMFLVRES
jgi:hypothetical protein